MPRPRTNRERRLRPYNKTHRELIETAVRLISEHGTGALSIASLARTMGIDRTSVYYHFSTRESLLAEVKRWSSEQLAKAFASEPTQEGRVDYTIRYGLENSELIKLWIDDFLSARDVRECYPLWDTVVDGLRKYVEDNRIDVDAEVFFLNILTNAVVTPRIYRLSLHPELGIEETVRRFKAEHIRLLRGILGRSRPPAEGLGRLTRSKTKSSRKS